MPEPKSQVVERIWGNVEPSIDGYSRLISLCLDRMSKEQCRELLATIGGFEYERQPDPLVTLQDHGDGGEPGFDAKGVRVFVEADQRWIWISPEGYGEATAADGHGAPIGLEYYNGRLRLIVFSDINEQDPQIIDMEDARESNRKDQDE